MLPITLQPVEAHQGGVFAVPESTIPVFMDGILNTVEWFDARLVASYISPNQQGRFLVFAKYEKNSQWLYLGFYMDDNTEDKGDTLEVAFNTKHEGGLTPTSNVFSIAVGRVDTDSPYTCWKGNGVDLNTRIDCSQFPYARALVRRSTSSSWVVEMQVRAPSGIGIGVQQRDYACSDCARNIAGMDPDRLLERPSSWEDGALTRMIL